MKEHSIKLKEECKHHYIKRNKFSFLCNEIVCNKCGDSKILKGYDGIYKNIVLFNELFYYMLTDHILSKTDIENIIPYRIITPKDLAIYDIKGNEEKIEQTSCIIDSVGTHSRLTLNNENLHKDKIWPGWIYWIDVWVSRLDCSGDSNLLLTKDSQIIPIDFNVMCTWYNEESPNYHAYDIFKFSHFKNIYNNRSKEIKEIISEIDDDYLIALAKDININNALLDIDEEIKYVKGLIYRKSIFKDIL